MQELLELLLVETGSRFPGGVVLQTIPVFELGSFHFFLSDLTGPFELVALRF